MSPARVPSAARVPGPRRRGRRARSVAHLARHHRSDLRNPRHRPAVGQRPAAGLADTLRDLRARFGFVRAIILSLESPAEAIVAAIVAAAERAAASAAAGATKPAAAT